MIVERGRLKFVLVDDRRSKCGMEHLAPYGQGRVGANDEREEAWVPKSVHRFRGRQGNEIVDQSMIMDPGKLMEMGKRQKNGNAVEV